MSAKLQPAYVFDAAATLGIGTPSKEPLPPPEGGFIILRIPDGLSLVALRKSAIGQRLMWCPQDWHDKYRWSREALPAGAYRLRVPVTGSNNKTAAEQAAMLPKGEQFGPAVLVAAALLCVHLAGGSDPLCENWIRCGGEINGSSVILTWYGGRVRIYDATVISDPSSFLWASSVRQIS